MENIADTVLKRRPFSDYDTTFVDTIASAASRLFGDAFLADYERAVDETGSGAVVLAREYGLLHFFGDAKGDKTRRFSINDMVDSVQCEISSELDNRGKGDNDSLVASTTVFGKFGSRYGEQTVIKNLDRSAEEEPTRVFILHMSVAFQLTVEECENLLKNYEYHPLHAKSPLDMAILVTLKSCDQNRSATRNCFEEVYSLLYEGCRLYLLIDAGKYSQNPYTFVPDVHGDSTTVILNRTKSTINSEAFPLYMAANFDVFTERHSKLLAEYSRLISVLYYLFNNGDHFENEFYDRWNPWAENISFFSEYADVLRVSVSYADPKQAVTAFFANIVKKGYHPTREVMIWLWIYEYCLIGYSKADEHEPNLCGMGDTVEVTCPHTAGLRFLDFMIKKQKMLDYSSPVNPAGEGMASLLGISERALSQLKTWNGTVTTVRFEPAFCRSVPTTANKLQSVFHSRFDMDIERAHNQKELMHLNICALLGDEDYKTESPWDGSYLREWVNNKLESFHLEPLNTTRRFDTAILGLCDIEMEFDKSKQDYRIHFSGHAREQSADFWFAKLINDKFGINPYQDTNHRIIPTKPEFANNIPFRFILVSLYIDAMHQRYQVILENHPDFPRVMPLAFHPCEING